MSFRADDKKKELLLQQQMMHMATGHFRSQAIYVAAKLGIADILKDGPKTVAEISKVTKAPVDSLYRLLRALASVEIFVEIGQRRFDLTPLAVTLQKDSTSSLRPLFIWLGEEFHWTAWGQLLHSVKTQESAFEHINEMEFFAYLKKNPEAERIYEDWMARVCEMQLPYIVDNYDFSWAKLVVDIGGGYGSLLAALFKKASRLKGILFDTPAVIQEVRKRDLFGIQGRCEMISGDFFKSVPKGGDLYILKSILHDWSDELSLKILKNCHKAMGKKSRLLAIEMIVPEGNRPHASKFTDLNMLVLHRGGRERPEAQYKELLGQAGFKFKKITMTYSPISLIEAIPI